MLTEAADRAGAESVATLTRVAAAAPPQEALPAMIRAYLSKEHVDGVETGCPVAALGSETPRQAPKVRRAATRRIKDMIDNVVRHSPDHGDPGVRSEEHTSELQSQSNLVCRHLLEKINKHK